MKIFAIFLLLCLGAYVQAQEIGTVSTMGTITDKVGTITEPIKLYKPYPISLLVQPKETTIKAGQVVDYIVKVKYSNGDIKDVEKVTYQNLPSTKVGSYTITIIADGLSTTAIVRVIPNDPVDMIIHSSEINFGTTYFIKDKFKTIGIDKYGNQIHGLPYSFEACLRNPPSKLFNLLEGKELTLPDGKKIPPDILQSGILIMSDATFLCHDQAEFIGTITLNNTNIAKTFTFTPQILFSYHALPFKITGIDTVQCTISVDYYLHQIVNKSLRFPAGWLEKFTKTTLRDSIEVICYIYLLILNEGEKVYKDNLSELLLNTILKPFRSN